MLIAPKIFEKLLPTSMHSRWDTWSKTWLPLQILPGMTMGFVLPTMNNSAHPLALGALYAAGIAGFNASAMVWHLRNRKEWNLPHEAWKNACEKIENKLRPSLNMPHRYRMSALCNLSQVLKSAEIQRLQVLSAETAVPKVRHRAQAITTDWSDSYRAGTIAAMLLKPEMLDTLHTNLGFTQTDIERWVEASYLHTIHEELLRPLPGTLDTIAALANDNPATMAFYLFKHNRGVAKLRQYGAGDEEQPEFWDESPNLAWFEKTVWAPYVQNAQNIYNQLNADEHTELLAMDLYKQIAHHQPNMEPVDSNVFDAEGPSFGI